METGGEKSREMHTEIWDFKCWTDFNQETMWVVQWGLLDSMKLKHKMKLWTKMKFSPTEK
jgi:hypothetical protein